MDSFMKGMFGAITVVLFLAVCYGAYEFGGFWADMRRLEKKTNSMEEEHRTLWLQYELDRDVNGRIPKRSN